MHWIAVKDNQINFMIEEEEYSDLARANKKTWYRLSVWTDKKGLYDSLQESLALAQEDAYDNFALPLNAWRAVD
jgi:hypothetical protein